MMQFHLIIFNTSTFIEKFAEQLKHITYIYSNIILKLVHVIKVCEVCTDRQSTDCNVTCHMMGADTHTEKTYCLIFFSRD
jgi:hypothetical protein